MTLEYRIIRDNGSGSAESFLDIPTTPSVLYEGTSKLSRENLEDWGLREIKSIEDAEDVYFQIKNPCGTWDTINSLRSEICRYYEAEMIEDPTDQVLQ